MSRLTIGIDLAKNVFQVHGIDDSNRVVITQKVRRAHLLAFFANWSRASSAWKRAAQRTIGRAN